MTSPADTLHILRETLKVRYVKGPVSLAIFEFISFGVKQAWACLFGGAMLAILIGTYMFYPDGAVLHRYDFITIMAIGIQILFLVTRLETLEEAGIILIFHVVGTIMEIFKTYMGSWVYPEPAVLNVMGVPLFSGFMYACVGSYIARVWRIFDFRYTRFPPLRWQALLALLVYVNFFTHHYLPDFRYGLFFASLLLYGPAMIYFKPDDIYRRMPLFIGLWLVAIFIWFAENLGTFARAWTYPNQEAGWHMVSLGKLGSWYLLMLISFVLVAAVHRPVKTRKSV